MVTHVVAKHGKTFFNKKKKKNQKSGQGFATKSHLICLKLKNNKKDEGTTKISFMSRKFISGVARDQCE